MSKRAGGSSSGIEGQEAPILLLGKISSIAGLSVKKEPDMRVEPAAATETSEPNEPVFMDVPPETESSILPPKSAHADEFMPSFDHNTSDVVFVKENFQAPTVSTSLAKIMSKDEPVTLDKGKAKMEFPELSALGVEDLYQQYLTRLSDSREIEKSMIDSMKEKYEVIFSFYH